MPRTIAHLEEAGQDSSVRVIILTGKDKIFSSGMNVQCFLNHQEPVNAAMFAESVPKMFETLIDFPKPIIAAVNGVAVGWGVTVCGLADITLMAEGARLKCPFASLSNVPEAASTYSFPRLMGNQNALWTLLSNEWVDASRAREIGFAMEVINDDELLSEAMRKAQTLAQFPTVSLVATKKLMMDHHREPLKKANIDELKNFNELLNHPACQEGVSAFKEKRQPDFSKF
jgi:enoyl-CoA hydratase/carnithine racemase